MKLLISATAASLLAAAALFAATPPEPGPAAVHVARFDKEGRLLLPDNLDEWVFLGSSIGMGYSQASFDPDSPGMFQVARMEPRAYEVFRKTGAFPEGTMIALHFYGSRNEVSINRAGFVMGELQFAEIHYKDRDRFPDGFNFYNLPNGATTAEEIALPNECVACHQRDGAYDGVFVQFYPAIHRYLPPEIRAKLATAHTSDAH
jgi:Cytochrome P460